MISADTSSVINFLKGETTPDAEKVAKALANDSLTLAPIVVTELLSFPQGASQARPILTKLQILDLRPGYWNRAGDNRRLILQKGFRARTADALIAQCCIDADVPLIFGDTDFRHYVNLCGLKRA